VVGKPKKIKEDILIRKLNSRVSYVTSFGFVIVAAAR
jgi:hypothetical protein